LIFPKGIIEKSGSRGNKQTMVKKTRGILINFKGFALNGLRFWVYLKDVKK